MKTLLTPSLIAIACFSSLTAAAEVAVSAQSNSSGQLQFNQHNSGTAVISNQQATDSITALTGTAEGSAALTQNLLTQGVQNSTSLTGAATAELGAAATTSLTVLNNSANQVTAPGQQLQSTVATDVAANAAGSISQQMQQQLSSTTSQLVQQSASAAVTQTVSQAVSAEVNNTVRNTIKLSTGL